MPKKKLKTKIPMDRSSVKRCEKLDIKVCQFPGCNEQFESTGKAKFCPEHRQMKYRKIIDAEKNEERKQENLKAQKINQIINHNKFEAEQQVYNCETCNEPFTITILQGIFTYPKNCPTHRNKYQRERYLEQYPKES